MIVVVKPNTTTITVIPRVSETIVNSPITTLAQMSDVSISNPINGDTLKYESGEWINSQTVVDNLDGGTFN